MMITLVDDDQLIVSLLGEFLGQQEGIEILNKHTSGEEFITQLELSDQLPEILILDLKMKESSGLDILNYLHVNHQRIKVIILSSHYKPSYLGYVIKSGAAAFLPKGTSPATLLQVIKNVHQNGFHLEPNQVGEMRNQLAQSPEPKLDDLNALSERELEVLKLIVQQKTAQEIGELLFITKRTVEGHKSNLFQKTGAKNIAGLVVYAIQNKIVEASELPII